MILLEASGEPVNIVGQACRNKCLRVKLILLVEMNNGGLIFENFGDAFAGDGDDLFQLRRCGAIGRHQHDDISDGTCQHAARGHCFTDADASAFAQVKRLAGAPVFYQFNSDD